MSQRNIRTGPDELPARRLRRFAILVFGAWAVALVLIAGLAFGALQLEAAVRSYVKGESLWSKAQKDAVAALRDYADDGDQTAWMRYRENLEVPLGDRRARLELERPSPDLERAREGFLQGGLEREEIGGMIRLFRWAGAWAPMRQPIRIWAAGDSLIAELQEEASAIHAQWQSGSPDRSAITGALGRVDALDRELARQEKRFTGSIDAAADGVRRWSLRVIGGLTVLLLAGTGTLTYRLYRLFRRREEALRDSRTRLARTLDALAEGVAVIDEQERTTYVNPAAERITGLKRDELTGEIDQFEEWEYRTPGGEPLEREELPAVRALRTGEPVWDRTVVLSRPGRDPVVLSTNAVPVPRKGGQPDEAILSFRDVTERVRTRRELRERTEQLERSERRYRELFESSNDAVYVTDRDGTIVEMNPAGIELLGYDEEEVFSARAQDFYRDPEDREVMRRRMEEQGRLEGFEVELVDAEGEVRLCELSSTPRREDGEIVGYHGIMRDVTEQRRMEQELQQRALEDPLTGLPNRTLLWDRLEQAVARAGRADGRLAVLFLDVDRFKVVNDSLGHDAGDRVLTEVARRLAGSVREPDTVARVGGDEFVALLEDLPDTDAVRSVVDRIAQAFQPAFTADGEEVHLDASLGLTLLPEEPEEDATPAQLADELVRRADEAMFGAKERPGTTHHVYDPEGESVERSFLQQENELRRALEEEQLELHYQPIVSLAEEKVVGVEPLVRWRHPEEGLIPPGDFLPLAENTGLILELGTWILERACRQVAAWNGGVREEDPLVVHPNLSATQFRDPGLQDRLREILESSGLAPEHVEMEITEHSVMQAPRQTRVIADLGVGICIDDFGTGYSSLTYVKELEASSLKVDMSFVHGIGERREDEAIIQTVLTLGRTLDLNVVAEGVETGEQRDWLTGEGCPWAQGFLFGRPAPPEELEELLRVDGVLQA